MTPLPPLLEDCPSTFWHIFCWDSPMNNNNASLSFASAAQSRRSRTMWRKSCHWRNQGILFSPRLGSQCSCKFLTYCATVLEHSKTSRECIGSIVVPNHLSQNERHPRNSMCFLADKFTSLMGISWVISTSCLTRSPNPDHFWIHFFPKVLEVELFAISLRSGYLSEKKIKQQNIKMYPNTSPLGSPLMVHPWFFHTPRLFQGRMGASSFMLIFLSSYGSRHLNCASTSLEEKFSPRTWKELSHRTAQHLSLAEIWLCHFWWDFELGENKKSQTPVT